MKCKICDTEFKLSHKNRKTCSEPCKRKNRELNKRWGRYYIQIIDTEGSLIRWKNTFILRAA